MSDFWSNLSGGRIHSGSWNIAGVPLPDFGVTEVFAAARNPQGRSINPIEYNKLNQQATVAPSHTQTVKGLIAGRQYYSGQPVNPKLNPLLGSTPPSSSQQSSTQPTPTPPLPSQSSQPNQSSEDYIYSQIAPYYQGWPRWQALADFRAAYGGDLGKFLQSKNPQYIAAQQEAERQQLQQQVDNAYAEAVGIFNKMRQNALAGKQDFLNQYTQPFEAQKPLLEEAKRSGLQNIQTQETLQKNQEQSALDAARRLYQELTQGVRQRYGGVNSAGDFARVFYGRELQRQKGGIYQQAAQNMQKLLDQKTKIEQGYQAKLQSLAQQEQAALLQAKNAFRDRLNAIDNAKAGLAQNKAAMKLDALRNYRAQQQAIQNAVLQHKMQLDSMVKLANLNLRNAIEGYKAQIGKVPQLYQYPTSFNTPRIGGGSTQQEVTPTGYLPYLFNRKKEMLAR